MNNPWKGFQIPKGDRPIVLQRGSGGHRKLMQLAGKWNGPLLEDAGFDYIWASKPAQAFRSPNWDKWFLLAKYLAVVPDGTVVCWIDSDCLVVGPMWVPEGDWNFAACPTESGLRWQIGVCWFRADQFTRKLCELMYVEGAMAGDDPDDDQQRFNKIPIRNIRCKQLTPDWNYWGQPYWPVERIPEIKVRAWHGRNDDLALIQMSECIEVLSGGRENESVS